MDEWFPHTHTQKKKRKREKRREKESGTKNVAKFWARRTFLRRALLLFLHANERTNERTTDRTSSDNKSFSLSLSLDFISKKRQECSFFVRACLWDRSRYFLVFFQSKTFLLFYSKKQLKNTKKERETLLFKNLLHYKSNPRKNATEEEEEEEEL